MIESRGNPVTLPARPGPLVITRGDAAALPLPDESVDLIVTSPPYFGLRSYQDDGDHMPGQIGDEDTPAAYLDALIACTAEWMRVLKPGGSIFCNLGDRYAGSSSGDRNAGFNERWGNAPGRQAQERSQTVRTGAAGMAAKSLVGLPWRYAIRAVDDLGLILRAEIVWAKPNGLPESVTDRVRRSHEQVFHLTKQPRYYCAVDEVREETKDPDDLRHLRGGRRSVNPDGSPNGGNTSTVNPLGKLPGSVWEIPTAPLIVPDALGVDHFAAYPPELVRRIVLGWSPREVCTACGEGRRPVSDREQIVRAPNGLAELGRQSHRADAKRQTRGDVVSVRQITGYTCACPDTGAPATPGVVLDPFGGTGTTALVASVHGRVGISVDLSLDYCRLACWRTQDPGERARAADVPRPKPMPLVAGDVALFEL
jgi:DNA modification methylase